MTKISDVIKINMMWFYDDLYYRPLNKYLGKEGSEVNMKMYLVKMWTNSACLDLFPCSLV